MAEQEEIFSSKLKKAGIFDFKNFYRFCYDWLIDEIDLELVEDQYSEKIKGDSKEINIKWSGTRKITDYFKFKVKVDFRILNMTEVEAIQDGKKLKTNEGQAEIKVKGILIRDYEGKFESTAFKKFLRSIYEKWIIASRIEQFEEKLINDCDEFLSQAKAYLDLEGKR